MFYKYFQLQEAVEHLSTRYWLVLFFPLASEISHTQAHTHIYIFHIAPIPIQKSFQENRLKKIPISFFL